MSTTYRNLPDIPLLITTLILIGIGIVAVYSASAFIALHTEKFNNDPAFFLKRQMIRVALGLVVMLVFMFFNYRFYSKLSKVILIIGIALLAISIIPGVGGKSAEATSANRWIRLFSFTFQPAEIIRLALIIYLSEILVRKQDSITSFKKGFLPPFLIVGLVFVLLVLQPSFGAAVLVAMISFTLLFVGGVRIYHLFLVAAGALPILAFLIKSAEYRFSRWLSYINPNSDPLNTGYHIQQSLIALGSGKFWGLGLGQSKQKLFYLPEPHTDFIFSIIGEEFGFLGTFILISLFLFLAWRGIIIAKRAPEMFGFYLAFGITVSLFLSAAVNIGVVTNLLPTTGLPLPFISYGGSSIILNLSSIGILLNISRHRLKFNETKKYSRAF